MEARREGGLPQEPEIQAAREPPSGLAGGKVAKVDRVEWIWIADAQTQVNALLNGEIDFIETPPHDLLPLLAEDKNIESWSSNPAGRQYALRFNVLHKPFDNAKIRQAVAYALNQKDFLDAMIGDPATTWNASRCSPAARRSRPTKGWDDKLVGTSPRPRSSCRRRAMTARRSC